MIINWNENPDPAESKGHCRADLVEVSTPDDDWGNVPPGFVVTVLELDAKDIVDYFQQPTPSGMLRPKAMSTVREIPEIPATGEFSCRNYWRGIEPGKGCPTANIVFDIQQFLGASSR